MSSILKKQIDLSQTSPDTYDISWHVDWTLGLTLHGGCIAAAIHHAAATYLTTNPTLAARNQPDVLSLHLDFLRPCEPRNSTITITPLKVGAAASTLQLQLTQEGKPRVLALVTSTNFDKDLGPTATTAWNLEPPPPPVPDFDRVLAHQPDENWIPGRVVGELIPLTHRKLDLLPRVGFPVDGICDAWHSFVADERMDATYLALIADSTPSMSDTLLYNGGPYDAHTFHKQMEQWARENPGVPCVITNSIADAMKATHFNITLTMDIQYKRRLPREGRRWVFTRAATKKLQNGRMDMDFTICDEDMELLATARHVILVLDAQRKFRSGKEKSAL
ncbi:thioesterase family protein [Metarhizium acridum CQMa 102]|uniref:Thioesterase family protein n=1 Tax=Metarhizium acridum (strain CQMa 102) TaxID=655827 RepID=E9EIH5_METAQ|nr:thioesterase family protein [Metarhizium acridum CQMa 102]EFY84289.1 thioesterase family protein [Metarhizium acridum CQMa 102]